MKTTIFIIAFVIFALVYVGDPKINFKPFSISFEKPYMPFALFFLVLSLACYSLQYEKIGHKRGMEDAAKERAAEAEDELNG